MVMAATAESRKKMVEAAKLPTEEGPRSFAVFLTNAFEGEAERELSLKMQQLLEEMRAMAIATRRKIKGNITFILKMEATERSEVGLAYDLKIAPPKPVRAPCVAWVTEAGNAVFEPPRQLKLGLREVTAPIGTRDADTETPAVRDV
jgi:hypothetical protein